jgi:two-component sensor histidine kinase/CheY-like chemotaxis protein/PAS domain-containing protein
MTGTPNKTILLVEDEALVATVQKMALQNYGYQVLIANNDEVAIETVENTPGIDLILMDMDLGKGRTGSQAAKTILKSHNIPVVFLSAHTEPDVVALTETITSYGYVVKNSGITVLDASIKMAFKLFEANQRAFSGDIGSFNVDFMTGRWEASDEVRTILGLGKDYDRTISGWLGTVFPEDREKVVWYLKEEVVARRRSFTKEYRIHRKSDGAIRSVLGMGEPQFDSTGVIISLIGTIQDVTDRRRAEVDLGRCHETINRQNTMISSLLQGLPIGVLLVEAPSGKPLMGNETACKLLGRKAFPDITRRNLLEIYTAQKMDGRDPLPPEETVILQGLRGSSAHLDDVPIERPDGTNKHLEIFGSPVKDDQGRIWASLVSFLDISRQRIAEDRVKSLVAEKESLRQKVQNGVVNMMNTLTSLLSLQTEDQRKVANRVQGLLQVYSKLFQSDNFTNIPVAEFISAMVDDLVKNFPSGSPVKIVKQIDAFVLDADTVQPLGMIMQEILKNIMEHAFTGVEDPKITIDASIKDSHVSLSIEDNGVGVPQSIDLENSPGLGWSLAGILVKQLGGTIRLERKLGTKVILDFENGTCL